VNWTHHAAEAEFAMSAVAAAAGICRAAQQQARRSAQRKPDTSPVTEADYASQALIGAGLAEAFPHDPLTAEEDSLMLAAEAGLAERVLARLKPLRPEADTERVRGWLDHGAGRSGDRFWTLDPIDGTKGFLRGEQYVVALALIEEGRVMVAAVAAPLLAPDLKPAASEMGSAVVAVRGQGAWVRPLAGGAERRLAVSPGSDPVQARIVSSVEEAHTNTAQLARICRRLGVGLAPTRLDSQAKYLVIAGGQADLLIRLLPQRLPSYREKVWDVAAGMLVVEEAGGRVTDLDGRPLDLTTGRELVRNRGSLISNGRLHDSALAGIQAELAGDGA
jgi:3'(2'), 5'-bisphosphate nucleotidase